MRYSILWFNYPPYEYPTFYVFFQSLENVLVAFSSMVVKKYRRAYAQAGFYINVET